MGNRIIYLAIMENFHKIFPKIDSKLLSHVSVRNTTYEEMSIFILQGNNGIRSSIPFVDLKLYHITTVFLIIMYENVKSRTE